MVSLIGICAFFLLQLTAVNDKMAEYTNTPGTASLNAALMHTLQRHRDILQVCSLGQTTLNSIINSLDSILFVILFCVTFFLLFQISLQDYTHEFHKTKGNFLAIREREDLLGSVRKDIE